jgi:hypothetical protein
MVRPRSSSDECRDGVVRHAFDGVGTECVAHAFIECVQHCTRAQPDIAPGAIVRSDENAA